MNPGAPARARWRLAVALAATVGLALLSRRHALPGVLAEYTGDAGYATAAFFLLALGRPAWRTLHLAAAAWLFAAAIECAQLLSWPWLQELSIQVFAAV